jgi:hypothetical protein
MTINSNSEKKRQRKSGSGSFRSEQNKLKTKGVSYKGRENVKVLAKKAPSSEVRM